MRSGIGLSRVLVHVIVWVCFFLYPFVFHYIPFNDPNAVTRVALFLGLQAGLFYFNSGVLIPRLLGKRRIFTYLIALAICIVVVAAGAVMVQYLFNPGYKSKPWLFSGALNTGIFGSLLVIGISSVFKITVEWYRNQQMKQEMENEKLNAELSFLKAQINPHFLFNSLNSIYALAHKGSPDTEKAILKLAEQLRYVLYESQSGFVPLTKEIEYLNNYIDLQKIRQTKDTGIVFDVSGDARAHTIEPMLLVPLVENAFKHGITSLGDSFIHIGLQCSADHLYFRVENSVPPASAQKNDPGSGIGLLNIRRRLTLLYPTRHELKVKRENNKFIAELTIYPRK